MSTTDRTFSDSAKLTVVIPCFNEEHTLGFCIEQVRVIADEKLSLEIIIVDDSSTDRSFEIARGLQAKYPEIVLIRQDRNQGKGAALRAGFKRATGDFVAVQDADLEYDPYDLKRLIVPLLNGEADVVFGSRFLSPGAHRVLYYWHSLGNHFLTLLSNMFTDLNLTDMEVCYKVFRRDVIQNIEIKEDRFGFEPEIVAKVAHMRVRIFEMGVSYYGRTYQEGKKIRAKDGFWALYCIVRYNLHRAPVPIQFLAYLAIGGIAAIVNYVVFIVLLAWGWGVTLAAPIAFVPAAVLNYFLCIILLFRHKARWSSAVEVIMYSLLACLVALFDLGITKALISIGTAPGMAKLVAIAAGLILNFSGRRYWIFPEASTGAWKPQRLPSRI